MSKHITDEAVVAAANAISRCSLGSSGGGNQVTPNEAAAKERERAMREQAWDEGLREGWEGEIPDYLWALNPYRTAK